MKKIGKILYYLVLSFLGLVIAMLVFSILPVKGNIDILAVKSGSMERAIRVGSLVIIKPNSEYKVGEVVSFKNSADPKTPITHRIISEINGKYETRGDANQTSDRNQLTKDVVLGKVIFNVPYAGYVLAGVRQPVVFVLIILIPAGIIIYDEIKKIKKEVVKIKSDRDKKNIT